MENKAIEVTVNGKQRSVQAGTALVQLVRAVGADPDRVVVERNLEIVPKEKYEGTMLCDGDKVEIVQFVGGG